MTTGKVCTAPYSAAIDTKNTFNFAQKIGAATQCRPYKDIAHYNQIRATTQFCVRAFSRLFNLAVSSFMYSISVFTSVSGNAKGGILIWLYFLNSAVAIG